MANYEDTARRWRDRALGQTDRDALTNQRLIDRGDTILSYGSHFELGRILRDRKGQPTAWLINGNRTTVTTNKHRRIVLGAIQGYDLPVVTIPHEVLESAGILRESIEVVDVQSDWWTERVVRYDGPVTQWQEDTTRDDHLGGWQNTLTGEYVKHEQWGQRAPQVVCECPDAPKPMTDWGRGVGWEVYEAANRAYRTHLRIRHGEWEDVHTSTRNTGRKTPIVQGRVDWEMVANEGGSLLDYHLERVVRRHWLGGSLIRAAVNERVRVRCTNCDATGLRPEPMIQRFMREEAEGPLTQEQDAEWARLVDDGRWFMERWHMRAWTPTPRQVRGTRVLTDCPECGGTGRARSLRRRWAYYLSGFDENETRPSYFFAELPRGPKPTTVEEALDTLKPSSVRLAESMGREVARQGDVFAIPMPGVTLRELKKLGGVLTRHGNLFGTNHEATDVVVVGDATYARGTIRHNPADRRPDHKRLTIGKTWHRMVKNTVPVAA